MTDPGWPGWRGVNRDGRAGRLPDRLPAAPKVLWTARLADKSLGGVAATAEYVVTSDRERNDTADAFKCYRADTGEPVWAVRYAAPGALDFGNSPRATPLLSDGRAYLFGAFGHLTCADLATGKVLWRLNVKEEFASAGDITWGLCSSPLLADGRLIVNPGGPEASLAALDPKTGDVLWKAPGGPAGYGSLIVGTFGGRRQIVGHDEATLGGWDVTTGRRLWTLTPPKPKDFNVPTPIDFEGRLVVTTENNGTRLYRFRDGGVIDPTPAAVNEALCPDTHSPVRAGGRLFGVKDRLLCLDLNGGLKPLWEGEAEEFADYASLVASDTRLLAMDGRGRLLLADAAADSFKVLGRLKLFDDEKGLYAHPAVAGGRLFVRSSDALVCVGLE